MNIETKLKGDAVTVVNGVFIDNEWRPSASGKTLDVFEPATGKAFATVAAGDAQDIDAAVKAARRAFNGAWGALSATDRGRILMRLGQLILENFDELAALEARDTGKPMKQARADITAAARYFEFYGSAADKVHGNTIPFMNGYFVTTERVPFGVTGHIIPWNYPAQMFGRTLAPALATGNATVLKPAEDACLTSLRLVELARDAGFPAGAINLVPGRGEVAGAALAAHPGIDFHILYGEPRGRNAGADCSSAKPRWLHAGARRQVAANRFRRYRSRCRNPSHCQCYRTEFRTNLFGRCACVG
jgi:aldehyde dehydrogenase (NAD+)